MYPADVPPPPAVVHIDDTAHVRKAPAASRSQWPGIPASSYRGPYYDARFVTFRACVIKRESEGELHVVNSSSGAAGWKWEARERRQAAS